MAGYETKLPRNRIHLFDPVSLIKEEIHNNNPRVDQIPMYTALSSANKGNDSSDKGSSPKHQTMSPNSRTQAIARGRKELMEIVRDLPETFYELSLRDIVEKQKPDMEIEENKPPVKEIKIRAEEKSSKKGKKKMARSKSVDNEKFLLKTSVFPSLFGSKKSKKAKLGGSGSFKITPVPKSNRGMKGDESNGLRSSSTSSGSSGSSSRSNINSNSSDRRLRRKFLPSCCFVNGRSLKRIKETE